MLGQERIEVTEGVEFGPGLEEGETCFRSAEESQKYFKDNVRG